MIEDLKNAIRKGGLSNRAACDEMKRVMTAFSVLERMEKAHSWRDGCAVEEHETVLKPLNLAERIQNGDITSEPLDYKMQRIKDLCVNGAIGTNKQSERLNGTEYTIKQANKYFNEILQLIEKEMSNGRE